MRLLHTLKKGEKAIIRELERDTQFLSRVLSKGIRIDAKIEVVRNSFGVPMLIFASDTLIAISKQEARRITVQKEEAGNE
jgi:ferrous iron transport protein A